MFDDATGEREDFVTKANSFLSDVAWRPDGRELVATGSIVSEGLRSQVFMISYPRGELRRVTNDFNEYQDVSVAGGEEAIGAVRTSQIANLFVANVADASVRRLTSANSPEQSPFFLEVAADRVLFTAAHDRRLGISSIPLAGGEITRHSSGPGHATVVVARGNTIVFQHFDESSSAHVYKVNFDGTGLKPITSGGGEALLDVSEDGKLVTYSRIDSTRGIWMTSIDGDEPKMLTAESALGVGFFSRDGKTVIVGDLETDAAGLVQAVMHVVSVADGKEVASFRQPPQAIDPDEGKGDMITFLDRNDPARNVYSMNIATNETKKLTNFTDLRLTDHSWSPDFNWIALVRRDDTGENVWVVNASGGAPKQITKFDGEEVFQMQWTLDSKQVVTRAGTFTRDVVLISNFR
jgi:Tol biopolymer transport system component